MKDGESRSEDEIAVFRILESGIEELHLDAPSQSLSQLVALVDLLAQWAERINLTGHRTRLEMAQRLVLDAAALASALPELRSAPDLVDLGSGAGFPGLPLAILHPELHVRLVESRQKRHHFQREARRRLRLEGVQPILGRSDALEPNPAQVVVAQAMTQPEQALRLMLPWSRPGGLLILPASEGATPPSPPTGSTRLSARQYRVPGTGISRLLWVVQRDPE